MSGTTDPAAELALLLNRLAVNSTEKGSKFLASKFEVEEWSLEFYQILFSIVQRIEAIKAMLSSLKGFEHLLKDINGHLGQLKAGFSDNALRSGWNSHGVNQINKTHIQPLLMCSGFLRQHVSYPDLTEEEREDLLSIAGELLKWLSEHQLEDEDFIRRALIEGLENFIFRMEHLQWLGWGYSLESLKSVVMAYISLERGLNSESSTPQTKAAVKKIGSSLRQVFEIVGVSKDVVDRADFALKAYGALCLTWQVPGAVSGLLT